LLSRCGLRKTLRWQTQAGKDSAELVRLSDRTCVVDDKTSAYDGIDARNWRIGYVWRYPNQYGEAVLSVIDARANREPGLQRMQAGYEVGFRYGRDFGPLHVMTFVALRHTAYDESVAPGPEDAGADLTDWSSDTALRWDLRWATLAARWAQDVDRLWFTPDGRARSDRYTVALDLSQWLDTMAPELAPELSMNWHWSRIRLSDADQFDHKTLGVDFAVAF
jgi:hypothetical protein